MFRLSNKNIITFYLYLFCIQIIPIEGDEVSYVKVAAMVLALPLLLAKGLINNRILLLSLLYFLICVFNSVVLNDNYRSSTLIYMGMFLLTFSMYNGIVYRGGINLDQFLRIIKALIYAYIIVLLIQQLFILAGIRVFPAVNLTYELNRGVGANSLALEPSHAARIMTVAFYAFIKVSEIKNGAAISLRYLFVENRYLTLGFVYAMATMGSATAFIALGIVSLYFFKPRYLIFVFILAVSLYVLNDKIENSSYQRAKSAVELTLQNDVEGIMEIDDSAGSRVVPILNTINNFNLDSADFWFGKGSDTRANLNLREDIALLGSTDDYGFLSYLLGVLIIMRCCVTKLLSLETLLIFILLGFAIPNVAYVFGIYMILVNVKYFNKLYRKKKRDFNALPS